MPTATYRLYIYIAIIQHNVMIYQKPLWYIKENFLDKKCSPFLHSSDLNQKIKYRILIDNTGTGIPVMAKKNFIYEICWWSYFCVKMIVQYTVLKVTRIISNFHRLKNLHVAIGACRYLPNVKQIFFSFEIGCFCKKLFIGLKCINMCRFRKDFQRFSA